MMMRRKNNDDDDNTNNMVYINTRNRIDFERGQMKRSHEYGWKKKMKKTYRNIELEQIVILKFTDITTQQS